MTTLFVNACMRGEDSRTLALCREYLQGKEGVVEVVLAALGLKPFDAQMVAYRTEKQKAKATYGLLEKQFSRTYEQAARMGGITGENLLKLLECRLDNVVYRLGIAPTRAAARQLVSHCHICVNGNVVNIPSYSLKVGDIVSVREKSKSLEVIVGSLAGGSKSRYAWLEWDGAAMAGKFLQRPEREEIPENIKEQLIVELYSK